MNLVGKGRNGVECPECGSPRQRRIGGAARANDGSIPIHCRKCADCGARFVVATVLVPGAKTVGRFDEDVRRRQREYVARRFGYQTGSARGNAKRRSASDRLRVRVEVLEAI